MRTVTKQIREAFLAQKSRKVNHTETDGQAVFLHGNKIIERRADGIYASLAGWDTNTTKERVNGITGARFHHVGRVLHLNGEPVSADAWFKIG